MIHPMVSQLHFARTEFIRCLEGVTAEEAVHRVQPMNCLSWIVGHLANQEHFLWVRMAQGKNIAPSLGQLVSFGKPASTPPWDEMWRLWKTITTTADSYLKTINDDTLGTHLSWKGRTSQESIGTSLLRNTYHYWFHLGEAHAIRQMLGHSDLPQFVGNLDGVRYRERDQL